MSIYVIGDLHLSFETDKPMDIFGNNWFNHAEKIKENWIKKVSENDTVIIPGDFSWATYLEETYKDFEFLEGLPCQKILIKGNHDLWWSTASKMEKFFKANNFKSFKILFNNAHVVGDYCICGTRGWFYDSGDEKILAREAARLERSIQMGVESGKKPVVVLHYPPVYGEYVCKPIIDILKKYDIKKVYHGHIHGLGFNNAISEYEGIKFKLISADCIDFIPWQILDWKIRNNMLL